MSEQFEPAPVQVIVLPVHAEQAAYARAVVSDLESSGLRVELDAREESLSRRLVDAHAVRAPALLIVGRREVESACVTYRSREGQRELPLAAAKEALGRELSLSV